MIKVFECDNEKDRSGHPKIIYGVTEVKSRDAALAEVARYKKKSLTHTKLTHSASIGVIDGDDLYWGNGVNKMTLNNGTKCWVVSKRNDVHE